VWATESSIEVAARREAVWKAWTDVERWPQWNGDISDIALSGPFEAGSTIAMTTTQDGDTIMLRLADVLEGERFVDEATVADTVIRTTHLVSSLDDRRSRVVYRLEADGPAADQLGPAISADFPETLKALRDYLER
jgi:uncharacterized protein YndB with AHSA1/START domain